MIIEIDPGAGFCTGVRKAIRTAEEVASGGKKLYALGPMVHNRRETERLAGAGVTTISYEEFREMRDETVLIRSHGEPPETFAIAKKNRLALIDTTCPVVKRLQMRIQKASQEARESGRQIVILGKGSHPEVIGLKGYAASDVIVVKDESELEQIDFTRPLTVFAQTTLPPETFRKIAGIFEEKRKASPDRLPDQLIVHNTLCRQVADREPALAEFAQRHDLVIFVSDPRSSNGKTLFAVVRSVAKEAYLISGESEIRREWLEGKNSAGISGSNSAPHWQLELAARKVAELAH